MRRRLRWVLLALGALFVVYVGASFVVPQTVPRLAMFPRPPDRDWSDGCNGHSLHFVRSGPIWGWEETSTEIACPSGSLSG